MREAFKTDNGGAHVDVQSCLGLNSRDRPFPPTPSMMAITSGVQLRPIAFTRSCNINRLTLSNGKDKIHLRRIRAGEFIPTLAA